jgi:DNA replication and repair protein RecF
MKRTEWVEYLNLHPDLDDRTFRIEYLKNELSVARLRERLDLEKRMRKTSVGPQKDDFAFHMTQGETTKNVQMYGSRSEQRLAVFWMKLNEIRYVEDRVRRRPILLLDDVFSELDPENKKRVMRLIDEYQTILTTTEEEMIEIPGGDKLVIRL